jgi:hypothetical protein
MVGDIVSRLIRQQISAELDGSSRALSETTEAGWQAKLIPACVEIMLAADDLAARDRRAVTALASA